MDGFSGNVIPQLLEIYLRVKGFSRIGNRAFGKTAQTGIAGLLLPVAINENRPVIVLLRKRLRDIFIEQHVAVGNYRALCRSFPGI